MLLLGMGVLLLLLLLAITVPLGGMFHFDTFESGVVGVVLASIIWVTASLFAYFRGDNVLLALAGARKINSLDHRRLYNIVEELKIASGLETMPSLYIIDDPAMNAFAVGCHRDKAAAIVTSGLLTKLNRDELQGVIGHEIAHIVNRDVMLMSFCIMLLNTISVIVCAVGGGRITTEDLAPQKENWKFMAVYAAVGTIFLFFAALGVNDYFKDAIAIYVSVFLIFVLISAHLIYYATSRRREYLADASSALYTRYPEGLATALEKIASSTDQVLAANTATVTIYIVNPFRRKGLPASDITSTHPPVSERIRILRAMSHASFADYDQAYRQVRGIDKGIIPTTAMSSAGIVPMRSAIPDDLNHIQRARETTNALWNAQKYNIINCVCGTRLRLPPSFKLAEVKCPHCGRINPV